MASGMICAAGCAFPFHQPVLVLIFLASLERYHRGEVHASMHILILGSWNRMGEFPYPQIASPPNHSNAPAQTVFLLFPAPEPVMVYFPLLLLMRFFHLFLVPDTDDTLSERRHEIVGHSNSWDLGITEGERDSPPLRSRGLSFSNPGEVEESRSKRSSALLSPSGKPKSCSGDILAHSEELNILPIFHKLLSKRKETPGGFSGASCPNIIIKCDIVEYL